MLIYKSEIVCKVGYFYRWTLFNGLRVLTSRPKSLAAQNLEQFVARRGAIVYDV